MSSSERQRRSKRVRTLCAACQERKARFQYRGEVCADRDHTLCFECRRGEINRARARQFGERASSPGPRCRSHSQTPPPAGALNARQVAHRQRMLDFLLRPSAVAS